MIELPDTTWAYLAGLFDGEGTLTQSREDNLTATGRNQRLGYRLAIAQRSDTLLCEWVQTTLGYGAVTLHTQARKNDVSNWRCGAQNEVKHFLRATLPYLRVKQVVARAAYDSLSLASADQAVSA